ncbi:type II secretion system protein [Duganella sp. Root1480D1]|uniref:type II secretion system protein n=1 Tax=Duganella sp. Root1480D1 TaxID=1736471 RepID=UPI00070F1AFD|nr:type II secretion system protein [Duganella sp. Root1480D1]KQZ32563.1 general secretion pathway protein GspG [Duganella sp. Root1480D1]
MTSRIRIAGFSLVELLVSVAILAVLASVAMPVVELTQKRKKEAELRLALREIRSAIDAYKEAITQKRISGATDASGYPPTLSDLVAGVPDLSSKNGAMIYFLRRIPRDPFNSDPSVTAIDSWGKRSFASPANKPMPGADVFDIYTKSGGIALDGTAYKDW